MDRAERADYWQARALSEQHRAELLEGEVARLRAQLEAMKTLGRLNTLTSRLKADGVIDLTEGEWRPDDAAEQFVRVKPSPEAPVTS